MSTLRVIDGDERSEAWHEFRFAVLGLLNLPKVSRDTVSLRRARTLTGYSDRSEISFNQINSQAPLPVSVRLRELRQAL